MKYIFYKKVLMIFLLFLYTYTQTSQAMQRFIALRERLISKYGQPSASPPLPPPPIEYPVHSVVANIAMPEADAWENDGFVASYMEDNSIGIVKEILQYYDDHGYTTGAPHLAIVRITTVGTMTTHIDVDKIFLSGGALIMGATAYGALARIAAKVKSASGGIFSNEETAILQTTCRTIGCFDKNTQINATSIDANHTYPYAHSEVAAALYLDAHKPEKPAGASISIAIKDCLPMCLNCQAFWSGRVQVHGTSITETTTTSQNHFFLPVSAIGVDHLRVHVKTKIGNVASNFMGY
ncbi:MAG: hypothetical protein LBI26_02075 [Holosporales bacterium]|jgi:hypothetical protein|nr:hypothetical protein [Holosporales bacterium]